MTATALRPATPPADPADPAALHVPVLRWYDENERPLPWRAPDVSPWGVLLSEVMSQQTPVSRVVDPWRRWLDRWPTPSHLADAAPADVLRAWGTLGYPRRALRLHETAKAVVAGHGGEVPSELDALRALPGVGEYTAAAVAVFAFGARHPVVDVNVRRVLARAVGGSAEPAASLSVTEKALAARVLPADPGLAPRWSVAVMELGALVCVARSPRCDQCPVRRQCAWQRAGRPAHHGKRPRGQAWEGTDRQARGRVMAVLRKHPAADDAMLATAWPDPVQRGRVIASLVSDGLAEHTPDGRLCLPGSMPDEGATDIEP